MKQCKIKTLHLQNKTQKPYDHENKTKQFLHDL